MIRRRTAALLWLGVAALWPAGARAGGAVGVDELMRNLDRYPAEIRVEGVVSQVIPGQGMLALIDLAEFRECQVVTCAKLALPVRWPGAMPAVASTVQADGRVQKQGARLFFAARSLETLAPPPASK